MSEETIRCVGRKPVESATDSFRFLVPLLDSPAQYQSIQAAIDAAVLDTLASPAFRVHPVVDRCETAVAAYCDCVCGVGVASATEGLRMTLRAESIGEGDQVITSPCTSLAATAAILRTGAAPVLVDIDSATLTIDPARIEPHITARTRAVIPVHSFGRMADMEPILDLARRYDLVVIEEASQAIGAEYWGRRAGSLGDYGVLSFGASSNLGATGDGGLVTTNDPERAQRVRRLRDQRVLSRADLAFAGQNLVLDALQAAIVLAKLEYLDDWTAARRANAACYRQLLDMHGLSDTRLVIVPPDAFLSPGISELSPHAYNRFVVRVANRDELQAHLAAEGIETDADCLRPVAGQADPIRFLAASSGSLRAAERAARECLALPMYPELTTRQQELVVRSLAEFYRSGGKYTGIP